ncbi:MAG: hypothetical protein ACYTBJ_05405 [Planctomycetota bacterium]|jgi:hypothetical protein
MAVLPPDVRVARKFRIVKGLDDNIIRTDYAIDSAVTAVEQGEWVVLDASNNVTKATGASLAAPAQNTAVNWTEFVKDDTSAGQSDAVATNQLTLVTGSYQAETKLFESTGTFTPGFLLVVRESTTTADQGVLDAVNPATATAVQLAGAVGRVTLLSGGVLTYRSLGAA